MDNSGRERSQNDGGAAAGGRLAFRSGSAKLRGLRRLPLQRWFTARAALAVLAGMALAASFPKANLSGLAWVAPALMLAAAVGEPGNRAFRLGYLAGLAHYLTSLYWLLFIPFPAGAVAGWLALSAFLALFPATWVWLAWRLFPAQAEFNATPLGDPGLAEQIFPSEAGPAPTSLWLARFQSATWSQRTVWCLGCAAVWVTFEMILARFLTGFPWDFLGVSQHAVLPLIQIASVTGVYGVSFLVAWGSVALLCAGLKVAAQLGQRNVLSVRPTPARMRFPSPLPHPFLLSFRPSLASDLAAPLMVVTLLAFMGAGRLVRPLPPSPQLRIALVQPSIPQRLIFDPMETTNRFNALMELSRLALAAKPDLLVWPEASLPSLNESRYASITNLIATHPVWMILGADDAERRPSTNGSEEYDYYNSALLLDPAGKYAASYRKRQLVIFGEYVPLAQWLPFLRELTPIEGGFTPGKGPVPFLLTHPRCKISVLICYEDVFPHLVREYVDEDTDLLLNLTNNGWFGESAAQWQHAATAIFRAVENGLSLVRCTNNGLTCWIDALGRMHDVGFANAQDVYSAGFKSVSIPLLPPGQKRVQTFYNRHGDWFGWSCVGWSVLMLLAGLPKRPWPDRGVAQFRAIRL